MPAHGDLVEIRLGPRRAWLVCHPELAHEVLMDPYTFDKGGPLYDRLGRLMGDGLVTCRQPAHRDKRRLLQPAFRPSHVAAYTQLVAEEAESVCEGWQPGGAVPVTEAMTTLTTRVISRVLFSDALDDTTSAQVRDSLADVVRGLFVRTVVPVDALFRLPVPANRRYRHALARLHAVVDAAIAERRRGAARDDVLGTLLTATRGDGTRAALTDQEVHDHLITLLLTGTETSALSLASAFSLLARHPEAERSLHAELDTVLPGGRRPGPGDLPDLVRTRCVITETLRHASPGWLFTRVTTRETELAGCRLPAGATVLYSPYLLHHDPASFPDPERFDPDRWLPGRPTAGQRRAAMPFSAGNRKCLGDEFAMVEATVALATIAGRVRLRHRPGHVARAPRPAITLGPRSLVMACEDRPHPPSDAAHPVRGPATAAPCAPERRTAGDHVVDGA
ncbi:Epi-isozizaene 5-monooxygenase/(E)-beta-farnesene synthase [Streptomyces fuscichromogenes]|uniref:Epi-isozizaene 5-monooxygenase/(E)-beta-farnesene synthase n=1 Tax=Streptomyces fuscichromogenes TaxID=1324013 RepID=A0A918CRR6_9ACTN|nr:Epi-isozizaene 5-monooxygenase/(E)-beta-farnesene synthase [Streptomyces fuscichromogenes]